MYLEQSFAKDTWKFPCTFHNRLLKVRGKCLVTFNIPLLPEGTWKCPHIPYTIVRLRYMVISMYLVKSFAKGAWKFQRTFHNPLLRVHENFHVAYTIDH